MPQRGGRMDPRLDRPLGPAPGPPPMMGGPRVGRIEDDRNQPVDRYVCVLHECVALFSLSPSVSSVLSVNPCALCQSITFIVQRSFPSCQNTNSTLIHKHENSEKQCPMLLRIFCKFGEYHRDDDFSYMQQPVEDEVLVHTWRDATLAELTELLAQGVAANTYTQTHISHTQLSSRFCLKVFFHVHCFCFVTSNLT